MSPPNPNIAARLAERAARHPERDAIVEYVRGRARRVAFGELVRGVAALAAGLRDVGVRPGDRVLLFVPMSIDLYRAVLACAHAGAAVVFIDAWADRARLEHAVEAARPRAFVGTPKAHLLRLRSPAVRRIPVHWIAGRRAFRIGRYEHPDATRAAERVEADSPALLTFTTGSTGRPKVIARSHGFLWAQHRVLARHLRTEPGTRDMPTLPVFVLHNLAAGATSVLPDFDPRRPADIEPDAVHRQMVAEGVTTSIGSPAFYERLAEWCERTGRELPLDALFTGGASVPPALARRLEAASTGAVHIVYGSSEAEPIATIRAAEMIRVAETAGTPDGICVGRPVPEIDVRLIRAHDGPVALDDAGWAGWEVDGDGVGEVVVAGPHVVGRYHDPPEANALHKIVEGARVWHRTGDAARFDADGRLWLMGRVSERVRRAGRVWWSFPAELRAATVPEVRHAAYLGVPRDGADQRALLCVETRTGELEPAKRALLRRRLDPIPIDELLVLAYIPRDPRHASKTDRTSLRRLAGRA